MGKKNLTPVTSKVTFALTNDSDAICCVLGFIARPSRLSEVGNFKPRACTDDPDTWQQELMTRQMLDARMTIQALVRQDVDTVFGHPGGALLPIYDEIILQN